MIIYDCIVNQTCRLKILREWYIIIFKRRAYMNAILSFIRLLYISTTICLYLYILDCICRLSLLKIIYIFIYNPWRTSKLKSFATGDTLLCDEISEHPKHIAMYAVQRKHFWCFSNSETNASELLDNIEEMFLVTNNTLWITNKWRSHKNHQFQKG